MRLGHDRTIALRRGDKLQNFIATDQAKELGACWYKTEPVKPAKKDPRTFIGWALKAFYD